MHRILAVLTLVAILITGIGAAAADTIAPVRPVGPEKQILTPIDLAEGESKIYSTDFKLEVDGDVLDFEAVEVTVGPASFSIPDTPRTRELLQNRTHYDWGWTAYPDGADYWFAGPLDGSQFYCQYFPDGYYECFADFSAVEPTYRSEQ